MRLFEDRIEFFGIGWAGRHRRTLPLGRIQSMDWKTGGNVNLTLFLHDDEGSAAEPIRLHVDGAGLWKHEVQAYAPNLESEEAKLPDDQEHRAGETTTDEPASSSFPRAA